MTTSASPILEALRERIRHGVLPPGAKLNQVELAEQLGVSRIPLREALRSLHSEGLVVIEPGRGAHVAEHDRRDIADLYDLRLRLEPPLAPEIVDSLAPAQIRTLRALAGDMDAGPPPGRWSQLNQRFHRAMYAQLDRPHTLRIVRQVMALVEPSSHRYVHELAGLDAASREHLAMVSAIERREPERLEALLRTHLAQAREALLDALDEA